MHNDRNISDEEAHELPKPMLDERSNDGCDSEVVLSFDQAFPQISNAL